MAKHLSALAWLSLQEQTSLGIQQQALQLLAAILQQQAELGQKNRSWQHKCAKMHFSMGTVDALSIPNRVASSLAEQDLAHLSRQKTDRIQSIEQALTRSVIRTVSELFSQHPLPINSIRGRRREEALEL